MRRRRGGLRDAKVMCIIHQIFLECPQEGFIIIIFFLEIKTQNIIILLH